MSTNPSPGPATSSGEVGSCFAYVTKIVPLIAWIPNGPYPAGRFGSMKSFRWTRLKAESKTSTRPFAKSVAYRKTEGPEAPSWLTTNPGPSLKTAPVGAPGTLTTSGIAAPVRSYNVERSVPLSATHHGEVGPATSPHALTRLGSRCAAAPGTSDTRSVSPYLLAASVSA